MVIFFGKVLVIYLLIKSGTSIPVAEYAKSSKYEEYIVEHEISSGAAKNSVLALDLNSIVIPPGCQKCNDQEKHYCLGADLISDHCCCDKRYHEMFPYIPHTCYFGTQLCQTVANDCTEYHRLRTCCCQKFALEKFREQAIMIDAPEVILIQDKKIKRENPYIVSLSQRSNNSEFLKLLKKKTLNRSKNIGKTKSRGVGLSENAIKSFTLILFIILKYIFYVT